MKSADPVVLLRRQLRSAELKATKAKSDADRWKSIAKMNRSEIWRMSKMNVRLLTKLLELIDEHSIPPVSPTSQAIRKALYSVYRLHNPQAKLARVEK